MQILVIGTSPLPWKFYQALQTRHTLATRSLRQKTLFPPRAPSPQLILIWATGISALMLKKIIGHLRAQQPTSGVIIVGGKLTSPQRAQLLEAGARDCLSHTVCSAELLARIMLAGGESATTANNTCFECGDFRFEFGENIASYLGVVIPLNKKEALVLETLLQTPSKLVSKMTLYNQVWGPDELPNSNSLEVYMSSLRRKIERPFGFKLIKSVKGLGYRVY